MKPRPTKATEKEVRAEIHATRAPRLEGKPQRARLNADHKSRKRTSKKKERKV
jgi:hypothetical protein